MPLFIQKGVTTLLLALLILPLHSFADRNHLGFGFENEKEIVTIPFKKINNLIVLEATLDGKNKLNLILDTGIRSLVLFNKSHIPNISERTFHIKFTSTGVHTPIPATVSVGHTLRLSDDVVANQINAVILKRSNSHLHKINGIKIHGVFGYQLFARFQVKIDFENEMITLSEPNNRDNIHGFHAIPLTIHDTKPFIAVDVQANTGEWHHLNLILDLGANHKILIHDQPETAPLIANYLEKIRIAEGLSGSIYGYRTTFEKIKIGPLQYASIDILIPTISTYYQETMPIKKHGSLGSKFFAGQTIIIDYVNAQLLIKSDENPLKYTDPLLVQKTVEAPFFTPDQAN